MALGKIIGKLLAGVRAGEGSLMCHEDGISGAPQAIALTSPAFTNGGAIPPQYGKRGGDISPPLAWSRPPFGTRSLTLIVEDVDAPMPDHPFVHALVSNIPAEVTEIPEGQLANLAGDPAPFRMGRNTFGRDSYMGPDPIPGHGAHHYAFQIFALSTIPEIRGTLTREKLAGAMRGKVLAMGLLTGTFERE
jgi:Raf kinase inhibitor-like YbhB/YbcL family protein